MTGKQRALVLTLAAVSFVAFLGAIGYVVWRSIASIQHPPPLTASDKKMVVTAASLVPFGFGTDHAVGEHFTSVPQMGNRFLQYEYSSARDPQAKSYLFVTSLLQTSSMELGAKQTFRMQKMTYPATISLTGGGKVTEAPELLTIGDDRYAAVLENREGKPVGNIFLVRDGRAVHTCMIVGVVFHGPEDVKRLLEPVLHETESRYGKK